MHYKIVFSDIDGTLLNSEHKITPLTEYAIKELQKLDIPFVIISARSPSGIYPIVNDYNIKCPIISYSGALILDENNNVLFHKGIKKESANEIINFIEKKHFDMTWGIYSFDQWIVKNKKDPRIINEETIVKAYSTQGDINSITGNEVHKILCICNPDKILDIENLLKINFPDYSIAKSSDILLEIMEKNITKATAVNTMCSLLNINISDTIAFGDNYNDLEMLQTAGRGFLMENAPVELKAKVKLHTADNDHDGIYYALKKTGIL